MRNQESSPYQRAKNFLKRRTNYETFKAIPYDQMEQSLDRVKRFLAYLGSPDRQYAIVHVAGTKGKGTTCSALDQIWRAAGYRVGLFVSPHLDEVVERFQINGQNCDKTLFGETTCALVEQWKEFLSRERRKSGSKEPISFDDQESQLTFFEWSLVIAVTLFARMKVDIAILETGLGGRFDCTNVCDADVSVLTSVSYDHCDLLGDTIPKIAAEKLGIVKTNAPLVCGVGFSGALYAGLDDYRERLAYARSVAKPVQTRASERRERAARAQAAPQAAAPTEPSPDPATTAPEETPPPEAPRFTVGAGIVLEDYAFAVDPQTLVTRDDVETVRNMARDKAREFNAPFYSVEAVSPRVAAFPTPPFDSVRRWNFEIALRVVDILASREKAPAGRPGAASSTETRRFPVSDAAISSAAANFTLPCRFEVVSKSPLIVVDGAHNRASVAAVTREIAERFPDKKTKVLFATTIGKDVRGMLAELAARVDEIILSERSNDVRALPLPDLIQIAEDLMDDSCPEKSPVRDKFHVAPDYQAFLSDYCVRAVKDNSLLCVLGSFYFAAKVRRILKKDD